MDYYDIIMYYVTLKCIQEALNLFIVVIILNIIIFIYY